MNLNGKKMSKQQIRQTIRRPRLIITVQRAPIKVLAAIAYQAPTATKTTQRLSATMAPTHIRNIPTRKARGLRNDPRHGHNRRRESRSFLRPFSDSSRYLVSYMKTTFTTHPLPKNVKGATSAAS
jgi:hypothetical protein